MLAPAVQSERRLETNLVGMGMRRGLQGMMKEA